MIDMRRQEAWSSRRQTRNPFTAYGLYRTCRVNRDLVLSRTFLDHPQPTPPKVCGVRWPGQDDGSR
jgi:hypothetical protein